MEPAVPPPYRDPEFESGGAPGEPLIDGVEPESYLRVLANPFLGFVGFVVWVLVARGFVVVLRRNVELIGPLSPILVVLLLASLWLIPVLFHYHCLDCGATGRLNRWRTHVCTRSRSRRLAGRRRRFRGPTPFVQICLWLWGALLAAIAWSMLRG